MVLKIIELPFWGENQKLYVTFPDNLTQKHLIFGMAHPLKKRKSIQTETKIKL